MRAQYQARAGRYPRLSAEGGNHGFQGLLSEYSYHRTGPGKFLPLMQVFAYPLHFFVPAESSEVRRAERSAAGAKEIATGVVRGQ